VFSQRLREASATAQPAKAPSALPMVA
jgi:hypothetical protein